MKTRITYVNINGMSYSVPANMSDKELSTVCAMLLNFRPMSDVYSTDYKKTFHYVDEANVSVRLGSREVYSTEETAKAARDAYNQQLEQEKQEA
jgi:hypothetical protein